MKKSTMKRIAALLLSVVLLTVPFAGCGNDDFPSEVDSTPATPEPLPTLTLWIDIPDLWGLGFNTSKLLDMIPGQYKDFIVLSDTLTNEEPDRSNRLTNMRVEMMAGKGPDVFLCSTGGAGGNSFLNYDVDTDTFTALGRTFPFPEQAMKNRMFLPLDDYIANYANRMDWEKLDPVIMEAGRNEEGQQLMPLGYSFYVSLYDRETYTLSQTLPMTHQEMLDSGDPLLVRAALGRRIWQVRTDPIDFDHDALNFTEEEFRASAWVDESYSGFWAANEDAFIEGTYTDRWLGEYSEFSPEPTTNGVGDEDPEYWMVPAYNDKGGITAEVSTYAAINRNTEYPEYAFRVVDTLLSEQVQKDSGLYQRGVAGMPVHMELGTREKPFVKGGGAYYMNDWNREQFEALHGQINAVYFANSLEEELTLMWQEVRHAGWTEEAWEKAIKKSYSTMKMMVGES